MPKEPRKKLDVIAKEKITKYRVAATPYDRHSPSLKVVGKKLAGVIEKLILKEL